MGQLTWIGSLPNTSPNSEKTPNAATAIWTLEKAGRPAPPALIDGGEEKEQEEERKRALENFSDRLPALLRRSGAACGIRKQTA
jgi:hypothetical protein